MGASDSPPIGLSHPTANPHSNGVTSTQAKTDSCECNDCGCTVEIAPDMPSTCPDCGGALTRVTS